MPSLWQRAVNVFSKPGRVRLDAHGYSSKGELGTIATVCVGVVEAVATSVTVFCTAGLVFGVAVEAFAACISLLDRLGIVIVEGA